MTSPPGRMDNARWREAKAYAILASGGQCQICRGPLDPTAPRSTPWATEVDHIVPLSQGGAPYDQANLRAVHRHCHQQKPVTPAWRQAQTTTPRGPCVCVKPPGGSCVHLRTSNSW
jgi:5-methylcytosine-specific restriction endonuclease McrA